MSSNVPRQQAEKVYQQSLGERALFNEASGLPEDADGDDRFLEMVDPDGVVMKIPHTVRINSGRLWAKYKNKNFKFLHEVTPEEIELRRAAATRRELQQRPLVEVRPSQAGALEAELAATRAELERVRSERASTSTSELAAMRAEIEKLKAAASKPTPSEEQPKPSAQGVEGGSVGLGAGAGAGAGADAGKGGKGQGGK
jgi:hypothetical protein